MPSDVFNPLLLVPGVSTLYDIFNYDPWLGSAVQTHRKKAICIITVGGTDVTSKLEPHLISVRVEDSSHPRADIELDDRDALLPIPPIGTPVDVVLGWENEGAFSVFRGVTQDLEHGFGRRQGGRRMWVHASGIDMMGDAKTPIMMDWGEGDKGGQQGAMVPFSQVASEISKYMTQPINTHSQLGSIERSHWAMTNESPMHFMTRMVEGEMGGVMHYAAGDVQATIKGENADGSPSTPIVAKWADNLIGWRVRPLSARGAWGGGRQMHFDEQAGQWLSQLKNFSLPSPWGFSTANFRPAAPAPNSNVSGQHNDGGGQMAGYNGNGRIVINGEPRAHWGGMAQLIGARPGVDGSYWIETAEHLYSRQGYVTWLDVQVQAGDGASGAGGSDSGWSQGGGG